MSWTGQDAVLCPTCSGDGWYSEHEPACYEAGECIGCDGVQVPCETCYGTGFLPCSALAAVSSAEPTEEQA